MIKQKYIKLDKNSSVPLYFQIMQDLKNEISVEQRLPSERKLAEVYEVSRMTARKSLEELKKHLPLTRIRGNGTFVANIEKVQPENKISRFRFIFPRSQQSVLSSSFYLKIFLAAEKEVLKIGMDFLFSSLEKDRLILLNIQDNEALIVVGVEDKDFIRSIVKLPNPLCLIDCGEGLGLKIKTLQVDNFNGAYMAVKYLVDAGHRNIAFIGQDLDLFEFSERFRAYKQVLLDYNIPYNSNYYHTLSWQNLDENADRIAKSLLSEKDIPTALFSIGDFFGLKMMKAFQNLGTKIPEDLSIFGFGNAEVSSLSFPSLSSVRLGEEKLGEQAVINILNSIGGGIQEKACWKSPNVELVIRNSINRI